MTNFHVLPIGDIAEHIESADCPCHPKIEGVGLNRVIIHHAWDEREKWEQLDEPKQRFMQ
jgi:hypothetical protein